MIAQSRARNKKLVAEVFDLCDIRLNGDRPWDIEIIDDRFYQEVAKNGDIGFGEAYMEGWWTCPRIDLMTEKVIRGKILEKIKKNPRFLLLALQHFLFNSQNLPGSKKVAKEHYDIGNNLYELMLDKRMNYSCGFWKHAHNLDEAQEDKLEMICQKLQLEPGMSLLDIGCGWGAMAKYAAEKYGVQVVGATISEQQHRLAKELCQGFPVEIRLEDYRHVTGTFDRIVSIGMFEHVGVKNYNTYMKTAHNLLKDNGLFLLHTIGCNRSVMMGNPWIEKYIFPNSMLPSIKQIGKSIENRFIMEDWHNFGPDYEKTLNAWHHNFNANWPILKESYTEKFKRMWNFYLLICAGGFRARHLQLWQIILSKNGAPDHRVIRDLTKTKQPKEVRAHG